MELASPFIDNAVLQVCLGVTANERSDPWAYKPLLVQAMRGVVPDRLLTRRTKGNASSDVYVGLRRNRDELVELCSESRLHSRGLIDAGRLADAIRAPMSPDLPLTAMSNTLSVEVWVRAQEAAERDRRSEISGLLPC